MQKDRVRALTLDAVLVLSEITGSDPKVILGELFALIDDSPDGSTLLRIAGTERLQDVLNVA